MSENTTKQVPDEKGRRNLARRWLGSNVDSIDLYVEIRESASDIESPEYVRIRVDVAFLDTVLRRRDICRLENEANINGSDVLASPVAMLYSRWRLNAGAALDDRFEMVVDDCEFWFRNSASECETQCVSIKVLSNWLQGTPTLKDRTQKELDSDCFRWHGCALFYAKEDMERVVNEVLLEYPEVEARQLAIDMETRIRVSGDI